MKIITKSLKYITNFYNKMTIWGKVVILTVIFLFFVILFKDHKEGFEKKEFLFKSGP